MTAPGQQLTPGDDQNPPTFGVPEGAYVGDAGSPNAIHDLNNLTEAEAKNRMKSQVAPSFIAQRDGQWGLMQDMLDVMLGRYDGDIPPFIDGQLALNDRLDLLKDNGYCSMTLGSQVRIPSGLNRAVPFDTRVGPMNHAAPAVVTRQHPTDTQTRVENVIRLDRPGLWQSNVAMVQSQSAWESFAEIVVLKPDLSPYTYTTLPTPTARTNGTVGGDYFPSRGTPINLTKMFVVPDAGYYVQVRYHCVTGGVWHPRIRGGARFAQFSVTQWSSDVAATGAPENPTGEIVVD